MSERYMVITQEWAGYLRAIRFPADVAIRTPGILHFQTSSPHAPKLTVLSAIEHHDPGDEDRS